MDIDTILEEFHKPPPFFPASALRAAAERQEEITPALLELLSEAAADASGSGGQTEDMAWIYALFLLAQFREAQACPLLVRLASLPSPAVHSLLGDMLTEDLPALLASVSQGEPSGMQSLVETKRQISLPEPPPCERWSFSSKPASRDAKMCWSTSAPCSGES